MNAQRRSGVQKIADRVAALADHISDQFQNHTAGIDNSNMHFAGAAGVTSIDEPAIILANEALPFL